jgi:misacylated tRNA(Ala) deacylase
VVVGAGAAESSVQAASTRVAPRMIVPMARPTTAGSVEGGCRGRIGRVSELLYLRDAYLRSFRATVVDLAPGAVALDRTAFYPTGGGQPHDTGTLGGGTVTDVRKDGDVVWHHLEGDGPAVGTEVEGVIDWDRRHALMRTHTALHVLCGVIWNEWRVPVTGGNMEPLAARMDFEFDPLPEGFARRVEELVNDELAADRAVEVEFLPRGTALEDADLIRTKVSLVPDTVAEIRVVDIVGLDKQADGGTHVRTTGEVGRVRVVKTENKGKGFKRVRLEVVDA